jgi:hypothetical protein
MTQARTHTSANSPGAGRRYPGVYLGVVTDRDDPRKIGRVKVRVPELGGQYDLAWARVLQPVAGQNTGGFAVPPLDALVHVVFEAEDANRPVVVGAGWAQAGEQSQIPLAALGLVDEIRDPRGTTTGSGADSAQLQEPSDPYGPPEYPHNFVFKTPGAGHLVELDDTPGKERIGVTHGPSKSFVEIHPNGSVVVKVNQKLFVAVAGDNQQLVSGRQDVLVEGEATLKARGKYTINCRGYRLSSTGGLEAVAIGQVSIRGQTLALEGATLASLKAPSVSVGPAVSQGLAVSTLSHPVDYITGIPIVGVPSVLIG